MNEQARKTTIGVEVEFTGITRCQAIQIVEEALGGQRVVNDDGTCYHRYITRDTQGREWTVMRDASVAGGGAQSCELVTPVLTYENDIKTLQKVIRNLQKAGAKADSSCGVHIHIGQDGHTPATLRNLVNLFSQRQDLIYKALDVRTSRERYCKKLEEAFVKSINQNKPKTMETLEDTWYAAFPGYGSRTSHYHDSRYHNLNLHSLFNSDHHTIEMRMFNGTMHAGKIRAYIVLALGMNQQALECKSISPRPVYSDNNKFAMRTWMNRMGFIGDEFKSCRDHLLANLDGCAAWRFGA